MQQTLNIRLHGDVMSVPAKAKLVIALTHFIKNFLAREGCEINVRSIVMVEGDTQQAKIKAFVFPCKEENNDLVRCKEAEAEFYGLYLQKPDGQDFYIDSHIADFNHADEALSAAASLNLFFGNAVADEWDQMEEG